MLKYIFIKVVVNKSKAYFSDNRYDVFTKKYYFQLEFRDSTFSLLSRALKYINKTEVLQNLVFRAYEQIYASDSHVQLSMFYLYLYKSYICLW